MVTLPVFTTAITLLVTANLITAADPIVTLSHGGQLRGLQLDVDGTPVDSFYGECNRRSETSLSNVII